MVKPLHILNGPNLNLLGRREPEIYGYETLDSIAGLCRKQGAAHGLEVRFRQTNGEGELVTWIHEAAREGCGLIINPAGYTHTSVAIHDALRGCDFPIIELHLSNPHRRESFRHKSFVSMVATGVICGFGAAGYKLAIDAFASYDR